MASSKKRYFYWDSCVFLAYLNKEPGRFNEIESLWQEIAKEKDSRVITSTVSIVEVVAAAYELNNSQLDPQAEINIDAIWSDPTVLLTESPLVVMRIARDLMRNAIPERWRLHPKDAVHLATAVWINRHVHPIAEFHTYDDKLTKYASITGLSIREPAVIQPRLLSPVRIEIQAAPPTQ